MYKPEGWTYKTVTGEIQAHRVGWAGAWDAIKAALTGNPRYTFPLKFTYGCFVKGQGELFISNGSLFLVSQNPPDSTQQPQDAP